MPIATTKDGIQIEAGDYVVLKGAAPVDDDFGQVKLAPFPTLTSKTAIYVSSVSQDNHLLADILDRIVGVFSTPADADYAFLRLRNG